MADYDYLALERRIAAARGVVWPLDPHRQRAAELFGVPYAEVTSEQRRAAKAVSLRDRYNPQPELVG